VPVRAHDIASGFIARYPVLATNGTTVYTCSLFGTGFWGCDCVGWVNHKAKLEDHTASAPAKNHCKHILEHALPLYQSGSMPLQYTPRTMLTAPVLPNGRAISLNREEEV
jgi:hypothetical protein